MHDNRLAAALLAQGRDVVLLPLYTPLRTDEPRTSAGRGFTMEGSTSFSSSRPVSSARRRGFSDRLLD